VHSENAVLYPSTQEEQKVLEHPPQPALEHGNSQRHVLALPRYKRQPVEIKGSKSSFREI